MFEFILLGSSVGALSGFFGIGGGTILIPMLLFLGYATKEAIGISSVVMVGAFFSGHLASVLSAKSLEIIFLSFAVFALFRMFFTTKDLGQKKSQNLFILFLVGLIIGVLSMTIGVGGSIVLVPILVGFWHIKLKEAVSAGLFFVVFSSISGMISHTMANHVDFEKGITIGMASLVGVYIGIYLKDKVEVALQKKLLVVFYAMIVTYLIYRIFI